MDMKRRFDLYDCRVQPTRCNPRKHGVIDPVGVIGASHNYGPSPSYRGLMTQPVAVLGQIRLKSSAPTFSGTDFVCRKTCVKNRWIVDESHALMSFWDFLCGPASPETPASRRQNQHHQRRRLGDGGVRHGTGAAAGRLAEVGAPHSCTQRGVPIGLAPHDIVGGIDGAVGVVVAGDRRRACDHEIIEEELFAAVCRAPGAIRRNSKTINSDACRAGERRVD